MLHAEVMDTSPSHFYFSPATKLPLTIFLCIGFDCKGITQRICFDYNNTVKLPVIRFGAAYPVACLFQCLRQKQQEKQAFCGNQLKFVKLRKSKIKCGLVYP